jgi:hypothetical protein
LSDIGTTAIGHDDDIVLVGKGYDSLHLLVVFRIDNDVNTAGEYTVSEGENLSKGGSMRVHNTLPL